MAGHSYTAGGQASAKAKGIGDRKITSDSTVNNPNTRKATKNGNGPRR